MALEVLLFRSLFRNEKVELKGAKKLIFGGNRFLWLGGLVFHWSLLIILVRHLRLLTEPVPSFVVILNNIDGILPVLLPTLFITDALILLALTYLFFRRIIYPQIRYISLLSDYLALLLIGAVVASGLIIHLFFRVDVVAVKQLAVGVLTFSPVVPEGIGFFFYVHLFLICVLIAYFPFSKMMHAAGVFLSPTRNLLNNSRSERHVNPWDYPVKLHTYEEYEDTYREAMRGVEIPLEKE
jgi:nitrate reductase gamma subunit